MQAVASHPIASESGAGALAAAPLVQYPKQGFGRVGVRVERVLLVCFYDPAGVSTVPETVAFMQSASRFPVTVLNLFEHRIDTGYLRLHPWLDLDAFSAVILHNTVSYNVDNLRSLDASLQRKLRDFGGVKVLMKQDENYRFREVARYIGNTVFDVVFTCLPPEAVPLVYPPEVVGMPRFERMLTGYVTPTLRARRLQSGPRPIDIGYRGSIQPLSFGWLAYQKRKIGADVARLLAGQGLVLDISSRWEDRFGGDSWFDFLASCKATLGAESGASVFDLAGDLDERCAALERQHAGLSGEEERAEAVLAGIADLENNVHYNQISPRHFEAIASGTIQLLYPGTYSGILHAGRHFFALEQDYSNLQDAVELLRDDARREAMARAAFDEVILDPANWIETFVGRIDECVDTALDARAAWRHRELASAAAARNVLVIAAHDPVINPRLGWVEAGARDGLLVHQLGVLPPGRTQPRVQVLPRGNLVLGYERRTWRKGTCNQYLAALAHSPTGIAGMQELLFLEHAVALPEAEFCMLFGAPPEAERNALFRLHLQCLLNTTATLLERAAAMRGVHAIIATGLDTMPAALVLKGLFGVPLLYDAHEYRPEADPSAFEYERSFWVGLERRMVAHADARQTVSPGLAELMAAQYGVAFATVPNCELAGSLLPEISRPEREDGSCRFLFQGNFAVGRGIELLIQAWPGTDPRAILQLRGPDNPYKAKMLELAESTGLLGTRIVFPAAVAQSEMIQASADADVGLIPYARTGTKYRHCCPNKMSQYMAAGLPILANATEFVAVTVHIARCGEVLDFARRDLLVEAVRRFCDDAPRRRALGRAGRAYFTEVFNWSAVSQGMYGMLSGAVGVRDTEPLVLFSTEGERPPLRVWAPPPVVAAPAPNPVAKPQPFLLRVALFCGRYLPSGMRRSLSPIARRISQNSGA